MSALPAHIIHCPYCNEPNEMLIEFSEDGVIQDYVEDCQVCCRPIHVLVETDERSEMVVFVQGEDDV